MPDHRGTYAARFNTRGIRRPRGPLTDEEIAALTPLQQAWIQMGRQLRASAEQCGAALAANELMRRPDR